jgi:hypothetical protein
MWSREQTYEAAGKKDLDIRQQMSLEVESLRVVMDQKNEEIRKLRQSLSEQETKVILMLFSEITLSLAEIIALHFFS